MVEPDHDGNARYLPQDEKERTEAERYLEQLESDLDLDIDDDTKSSLATLSEEMQREWSAESADAESAGKPSSSNALSDDVLALYLNQIGDVPLLTSEDESALAKRIERGEAAREQLESPNGFTPEEIAELESQIIDGEVARQRFIEANTRLVISVAKRYRNYGLPFQDLIQAGNIGLIQAVDKFDYTMGNRFSTYAIWWIRQAVKRALTQQGHTIRLPYYLHSRLRRIHEVSRQLEKQLSRRPTVEEIAEALGEENVSRLREILQMSRHTVSLNTPVGEEEDSELLNLIPDDDAPTPAEAVQSQLMREDLDAVMSEVLTDREIAVLCQRFGLKSHRRHTLNELAEQLGVSRERVRQIERKALRKLRHPLHRRKLLAYLR
ncbi:MAG: sigma-70 family RNA polymerase sigma factor [Anaerolineae bacterium]